MPEARPLKKRRLDAFSLLRKSAAPKSKVVHVDNFVKPLLAIYFPFHFLLESPKAELALNHYSQAYSPLWSCDFYNNNSIIWKYVTWSNLIKSAWPCSWLWVLPLSISSQDLKRVGYRVRIELQSSECFSIPDIFW